MGTHIPGPAQEHSQAIFNHLRRLVQALRTGAKESRSKAGISTAQLFVLSKLHEAGEATINTLAGRTMTHQSSVSEIVSKLERARLVRRRGAKEDRRAVVVSITPLGMRRLALAPELVQAGLLRALESFGTAELETLAGLLEKWVHAADLAHHEHAMFFEPSNSSKQIRSQS